MFTIFVFFTFLSINHLVHKNIAKNYSFSETSQTSMYIENSQCF